MKNIKGTMNVTKYIDDDDYPTCAIGFDTGEVCIFYRTLTFGTRETCIFAEGRLLQRAHLDGNKIGLLIPGDWCPIWNKEELI